MRLLVGVLHDHDSIVVRIDKPLDICVGYLRIAQRLEKQRVVIRQEMVVETARLLVEIPDLDKKTRGFYNHLLADNDPLLLKPLGDTQISDADVERLIDPNDNRVMIVKYTNQKAHMSVDDDLIAPLRASVGEWNISVGFKSIAGGRPLAEWLASVTDIDNSVLLSLDGRRYVISTGPGARQATVDALNEEGP